MDKTAGHDPDRRQRRRGDRLHDGRRHRRRLVSDHPVFVAARDADRLYEEVPRSTRRPGKATFAIVQAEDEIAAIGMVIGAGWAGARAMTSTAGPGISLMGEFAGLAYYAEVPASSSTFSASARRPACRRAPRRATSLRPRCCRTATRKHILLLPGVGRRVLHDGDGGLRSRRTVPDARVRHERSRSRHEHLDVGRRSRIPTKPLDRGKVLDADALARLGEWGRYKDVDGDGIPYRTIPGDGMPAVLHARLRPQRTGQYSERPDDYSNNVDRLARKFETARSVRAQADRRGSPTRTSASSATAQPLGD